jgi:hypothetical protein
MADKLQIFKGALRLIGNNAGLSSLTEVSAARNALEDAWTPAGEYLLSKGLWNFAMRSVELSFDEDIDPLFGYDYAFSKPEDWVRTAAISDRPDDESHGFEDFADETDFWFADVDTLYVRYVSNDEDYGWNVGGWRAPFAKAMEAYLAFECGLPISSDKGNRNDIFSLYKSRLQDAKGLDAVDERVKRSPPGRLVRARITSRNQKDG